MQTEISYLLDVLNSCKDKNKPLTINLLIELINKANEMQENDQTVINDISQDF